MAQANDFSIERLENGNYVVKGLNIYQDIDFVNGGYITTKQRAVEIRDLLVEQLNNPIRPEVNEVELLKQKIEIMQQALDDLLLGGMQ